METFILKVEREITQQQVEDLLCSAFEGGSNYWALTHVTNDEMEAVGASYSFEVATRGGEIKIEDAENYMQLGVLNEERIKKAFELMALEKDEEGADCPYFKQHLRNFLDDNADAETADVFLQLAVMGKLVYG